MIIDPLNNQIVLKPAEKTSGQFYESSGSNGSTRVGEVVAVSPKNMGTEIELGSKVIYRITDGETFSQDGVNYTIIDAENLLAKLNNGKKN